MPGCLQVLKHSLVHRNANIHRQALRNLSWDFVKSYLTRQVDWENILIYSNSLREQSHNEDGRAVMVHVLVIFCVCACWNKVAPLVKLWKSKKYYCVFIWDDLFYLCHAFLVLGLYQLTKYQSTVLTRAVKALFYCKQGRSILESVPILEYVASDRVCCKEKPREYWLLHINNSAGTCSVCKWQAKK